MTKKIIRLLIGLLVIAIIVYAVATREGYSYDPNDGSETEAVADLIQENKRIEDDYEKSLEGKYEMEETNTWHDDGYKDEPNSYGFAFAMGKVDFSESYATDTMLINHSLVKTDGVNTHVLGYISPSFGQLLSEKNDSDF